MYLEVKKYKKETKKQKKTKKPLNNRNESKQNAVLFSWRTEDGHG